MTNAIRKTKNSKAGKPCSTEHKIGYETIHEEQVITTEYVMKVLRDRRRVPLVIAQFQSGKTAVMLALSESFIERCLDEGKSFQVLLTCGLSDMYLIGQTLKRFTYGRDTDDGEKHVGAKLNQFAVNTELSRYPGDLESKGIVVLNYTQLNKHDFNQSKVAERLVMIDEAHAALVKNGSIDSFLRKLGVNISEQVHTWDSSKTITHVVPVSATPFPQSILSDAFEQSTSSETPLCGAGLFKAVYMRPGRGYLGVKEMKALGRFKQVRALFHDDGSPSEFLLEVLAEFKRNCRVHGPGYLVVRATGTRHDDLVRYISSDGNIEVKRFDESNELDARKIKELNAYLSNKPELPELILIRGAMRAGITLKENYIRGWVETRSKQCDTQTQAGIGRACGYNRTETYPIYTQLKAVEEIIQYFEEAERGYFTAMPSATWSHAATRKFVQDLSAVTLMTKEQADAKVKKLNAASAKTLGKQFHGKKGFGLQITTTAGNNVDDIAAALLRGQPDRSVRRGSGRKVTFGIYINGANPKYKHKQSYAKLIAAHPEWEDKVVVFDTSKQVAAIHEAGLSYIKERASVQKDAPVKSKKKG